MKKPVLFTGLAATILLVFFVVSILSCAKTKTPTAPVRPEPSPVAPQSVSTYRIAGSVVDLTGNPVENVKVSILTKTNATFTDVNGKYSFENVDVGVYTLAGEKAGYTYGEVKSIVTQNGSSTPALILKDVREITGRKETESTGSAIKANGLSVVSTTTEQVSTGTGSVVTEKKEVKASIPSNTVITIDNKVVTAAVTVSAAPLQVADLPPAPKNEMSMGAAVFEPQRATFSQPVNVTVPMTMPLPAGLELPLKKYENGQWNTIGTATINASGTGADAKVSEFGQLAVQPKINVNLAPDPKPQEVKAAPINVAAGQTSYVAQTTDTVKFPSGLPKGVSVEYATSLIEKMKSTKIGMSKQVVIQSPLFQTKTAAKAVKIAGVQELWETEWTVVKKTVTNVETITITIDTGSLAKRAELVSIVITYEYVTETFDQESTSTVKWFVDVVVNGASGVTFTMTEVISGGGGPSINGIFTLLPLRFLGLTGKNYTLVPAKQGFTFTPTSVEIRKLGSDVSYAFTATPIVTKIPISGTVTGAAGVTVTLSGDLGDSQVVSADGGSYTFSVDANKNYTVTPTKTGYTFTPPSAQFSSISAAKTQNFAAARQTVTISGTVSGANGVKVTLSGSATGSKDLVNAGDSYSFEGLLTGTGKAYTVTATKGDASNVYIVTPPNYVYTNPSTDVTNANFTVQKEQKKIRITVSVDGTDGVTVTLSGAASGTVTLNDKKSYSWENLAQGTYTVTAQKSGKVFEQASKTYTNLQTNADFVFKAINNVTISGTLKQADGTAISGATVTLSVGAQNSTTSDASGNYSFSVQTNKNYTITPSLNGYTFSPSYSTVSVGNNNVTMNFTGTRWFTISGTVTGADGVTVTLKGALSAGSQVVAKSGGTYSFQVPAGGTYYVSASKVGITFAPAEITITNMQNNQTHNVNVQHTQGSIQ